MALLIEQLGSSIGKGRELNFGETLRYRCQAVLRHQFSAEQIPPSNLEEAQIVAKANRR